MKNIFTKSFLLIAVLATTISTRAASAGDQILLSARMNGAQETPAVTTNAVGVAAFSLNATHDTMCVTMTVSGLSGPITGAHIHSGAPGVSGAVVLGLDAFLSGNNLSVTLTGSNLTPALLSDYLSGKMYINVHTSANPNGEIRGQIVPETDMEFVADMNGAQETPAVTTNAFALGTFALSKHNGKLLIRVVADGLSGAIMGAHLHMGAIGMSGGVVADLTSDIMGNTIVASVDPTTFLADLLAGNIYINLHTAANPNGEIRGQLLTDKKIAFDAWIDGAQETPAVTTNAIGLASVKLNTMMDTLWYDVVLNGLSSTASGAHIHTGAAGVAGGVALNMSSNINGNRVTGMVTGATVMPLVSDLLKGNLYMNFHNTANPNGEIRGQIYSLLREGFTAAIDGIQETPLVSSSAHGTMVASIDRNKTDLHFMVVADGLSASGAHIHTGAMGQSGAVIEDLSSVYMNNGAFGYWKSTDVSPFTSGNATTVESGNAYVNLHTTANPNGEIRGQLNSGYQCYSIVLGVDESSNLINNNISVYPNPAENQLTVYSEQPASVTVQITNALGQVVQTSNLKNQKSIMLNIEMLPEGVYFLSIINADKSVSVSRFIKQ